LHAGIAGGGDVILIPEIPWTYENVCRKILERESRGKNFTLIVVAVNLLVDLAYGWLNPKVRGR